MGALFERFNHNAHKHPDKIAIILDNQSVTYRNFAASVESLSRGVLLSGVDSGDHVGVALPNCLEFAHLFMVAARLGLVLVPISPGLPADGALRCFEAAQVKHIIASSSFISDLTAYMSKEGSSRKFDVLVSVGNALENTTSWNSLLVTGASATTTLPSVPDDAPFIITMTSGSTGTPKPILLSQKTKLLRVQSAEELYGITEHDTILAATPLFHSLAMRLVLLPLLTGGTSVVMPRYSARDWVKVVIEQKITFSIAVSSQLKQMLAILPEYEKETAHLRCLVSSSALLEPSVKADLIALLKCEFHECYGTSELAIATNLSPQDTGRKLLSVGCSVPGAHVIILDDAGNVANTGQVGEIACRSQMIFSGYYQLPDATREAFHNGYFRTGDIGTLDDEGYLTFLGRKKEIIITGGINVYPKDVEDVLLLHPEVVECAVIPVEHAGLGEVVGAVIVARTPDNISARALQKHCARKLADYQIPHLFHFIDALPRNAMGKIMKGQLKGIFN